MIALFHFHILPILQGVEEIGPGDDDFSALMFCMLIIGIVALVALCFLVVVGVIVGLFTFAALTGIGLAGITANAVVSGLLTKSPKVGFTVLVLQFGAAVGLVFGLTASLAVRWLLGYVPFDILSIAASGLCASAIGMAMAWIGYRIIIACAARIREHLRPTKPPETPAPLPAGSQTPAGSSELPFR